MAIHNRKPILPPGHIHGRLTILSFDKLTDPRHPRYECRCECGKIRHVSASNLANTHSCGCLRVEQLTERSTSHGMSDTPEFKTWCGIIDRCSRSTRTDFERYGKRGIRVCPRWLESFANFFEDMGLRPSNKHSIDRINNDGDYEPSNCRWATPHTQRVNQRRTVLYTHEGVTGTAKDLARHFGANVHTVHDRMWRKGWDIHHAIEEGIRVSNR